MPTSLDLNFFDVNFGRDVLLEVVPVRDDQVSGPTCPITQSVSYQEDVVFKTPSACNTQLHRSWASSAGGSAGGTFRCQEALLYQIDEDDICLSQRWKNTFSHGMTGPSNGVPNLFFFIW